MDTIFLFPARPGSESEPDTHFEGEVDIVKNLGFRVAFVSPEVHFGEQPRFFKLPVIPDKVLYRGWILRPEQYAAMETELDRRGFTLLVKAAGYRSGLYLPQWEPLLAPEVQPVSLIIPGLTPDLDTVAAQVAEEFGNRPVVVKDFVKSRKHEWYDACYIADASDKNRVKEVTRNFLDLQGDSFEGGLVFREFLNLKRLGTHPKTKMPLAFEWRYWVWGGKVFASRCYWDRRPNDMSNWIIPPQHSKVEALLAAGKPIPSQFFAVDVGMRENGELVIIEINDGGTSGIPDAPTGFYQDLLQAFKRTSVEAYTREEEDWRHLLLLVEQAKPLLKRLPSNHERIVFLTHLGICPGCGSMTSCEPNCEYKEYEDCDDE